MRNLGLTFCFRVCAALAAAGSLSAQDPARDPANATASLDVADGLEATLFASEPMLLSPSNIDVDHRGRVWVCEVVNYRGHNGKRPEGDRILILEDTDGDGKADSSIVFYQGRDIDTALGICVLGNRVIVSVSPNVFVFTDDDGDGKADRKEALFTKTGEAQHDHSAHAFVFGPDGMLYWNFGNTGLAVHDASGEPVLDPKGRAVNDGGKPYRQGMVFRCRADGSGFEVLGHNFRNNYEVAPDSFGTLWQSDNDDDGNQSVRINYVMENGNFGYTDELTGAGWQEERTGAHPEVPMRHWRQNDPGVVPNLLHTGAGSPSGILVYEGELLPEVFRNQMIHCDPGPNVVRAYPVRGDGAGYAAETIDILKGTRDPWFRPSDVATAPDGSLFVADWYDPGVGGHAMVDLERGRIFRVAPPGGPYRVPKHDFSTAEGCVQALRNPNLETRYLAWTALAAMETQAEDALTALWADPNPRFRARALWLLGKIPGRRDHYAGLACSDPDPDLRITGLRLARQADLDILSLVERLANDPSAQVRRECALALHGKDGDRAAELWAALAAQHDGKDRWYLEALGIGAADNWEACFQAWLKRAGADGWNTPAGRDIVWRSRSPAALDYLVRLLRQDGIEEADQDRFLRAMDFHSGPAKDAALLELLQ